MNSKQSRNYLFAFEFTKETKSRFILRLILWFCGFFFFLLFILSLPHPPPFNVVARIAKDTDTDLGQRNGKSEN